MRVTGASMKAGRVCVGGRREESSRGRKRLCFGQDRGVRAAGRRAGVWLVTVCLVLGAARASADPSSGSQRLSFQHWAREDGLPNETVTALLQTKDGYLWVGTAGGLARFDGLRFEPVALPTQSSNGVDAVTSLCEDSSRRLWMGTPTNGIYWFHQGRVRPFGDTSGKMPRSITSLAESGKALWVGTSAGLYQVALTNLALAPTLAGLSNEFITSLHAARSGTVQITTRSGMSQYKNGRITPVEFQAENLGRTPEFIGLYEDRSSNLWAFGDTYLVNLSEGKRFNYFGGGGASSLRIWTLCEGRRGRLWIGTSGQGLFSFSGGKFRPLVLREGRLPSDVRAIYEDDEENLWLGTFGGGLIRLRARPEQAFGEASGLPGETASCIALSPEGRLWAGFERGGLFTAGGQRFERVGEQRLIRSLCLAPEGRAWVGTRGAGLICLRGEELVRFGTDSGLSSDDVLSVALGPAGAVWAGTSAGTVHRLERGRLETFGRPEGLGEAPVSALLAAPSGNVWAGTSTGGLFRRAEGGFKEIIAASALRGAAIRSLEEDSEGRLWVGTKGHGLACLAHNRLSVWDVAGGFPDNDVFGVLTETNGAVWAATAKGIFRLEPDWGNQSSVSLPAARLVLENKSLERESEALGFPCAARSADGRFWFALPGEIVGLDPREVDVRVSELPVYLEKVLANGVPLEMPEDSRPVRLPSGLASLEIRFTALNLAEPEKVRFQHKLDGFDAEWIDGGAERRARYGRLPHGNYVFHLRACNADGAWSKSQPQLALIYPMPAWRSPWALALYSLAGVGLVALAVRAVSHRRLRLKLVLLAHQQAMEKERTRIAQDMHDEIGSKLTKISYLSELALRGNGAESRNVESIATTSRELLQAMDEIVWAVNPRNDSLEHLAAYLGHYATEYLQNTALELELEIPDDLPVCPLSAEIRHNLFLAFEESLGNALKHSGAARLQVVMRATNWRFTITVRDCGCGFDVSNLEVAGGLRGHGGNGLTNMRQRLANIGGECRIESASGQGTTILLAINLPAGNPLYP
jgi:signal transduction histidine kinase/ligand-binding sensor domain-containing protein